jgi:ATP-dependent Clp protease ATP-binding subunit ClpA
MEAWPDGGPSRSEVFRRLGLTAPVEEALAVDSDIPFSQAVKRLLQSAMSQADGLGHHQIRPQHLLLALMAEPDSPESAMLADLGIERDVIRASACREAMADDRPLAFKGHLELKIVQPPPEAPRPRER